MNAEPKSERVTIMMTPSDVEAVDDWSFANRIRSRGEAIRRLVFLGIQFSTLEETKTRDILRKTNQLQPVERKFYVFQAR